MAFALPRSVGNAVTRNRLRRRLRVILRTQPPPPGMWLIGTERTAAVGSRLNALSFAELTTMLTTLLATAAPTPPPIPPIPPTAN